MSVPVTTKRLCLRLCLRLLSSLFLLGRILNIAFHFEWHFDIQQTIFLLVLPLQLVLGCCSPCSHHPFLSLKQLNACSSSNVNLSRFIVSCIVLHVCRSVGPYKNTAFRDYKSYTYQILWQLLECERSTGRTTSARGRQFYFVLSETSFWARHGFGE